MVVDVPAADVLEDPVWVIEALADSVVVTDVAAADAPEDAIGIVGALADSGRLLMFRRLMYLRARSG